MELEQILQRMVNPESLVEPQEIAMIVSHISGFITHYELVLDEAKLAYSVQWDATKYGQKDYLLEKPLTDKVTEIRMMRDPTTKHLSETKRTLGMLRRYRSDLNRKLDVIMGIRRSR